MALEQESPVTRWYHPIGCRLGLVACAPSLAQLLGSAFNIWYNFTYVQPLLNPEQLATFWQTVQVFNGIVYPLGGGLWLWLVFSLRYACQKLHQNQPVTRSHLLKAQQRAVNLPWWGTWVAGSLWLLCIPVFLLALAQAPGTLNPRIVWDLPISFVIAALIATTHSFFIIELASQRLLYPVLFRQDHPDQVPGTFPLSLGARGLLLAFCGSIGPIASLLLLIVAPHTDASRDVWFASAVGGLGIAFSLSSAWLVGQLVVEPIKELQKVAIAVAAGDVTQRINLLHADEFGPLIDAFNHMIEQLREKQLLQETFGRHVGEQAAEQILRRDPSLGGIEQEVTVVFVDLRNFTQRCATEAPQTIVLLLNLFLTEMVEIVEQQYGGMVNKFLGDGFMALFGVGEQSHHHATQAVAAAQEMLIRLQRINQSLEQVGQAPLAMGIGIHTGRAVVGSIGSSRRLEYTAIGDTVNVASRVEALTKEVGEPLLLTAATQKALSEEIMTVELPPRWVKGQPQPISLYRVSRPLLHST